MMEATETHDYGQCGLPVQLQGIVVHRCPACGEDEVVIPRIDELHRLIARSVIRKPAGLSGAEVRFLRKWLGHSGRDLAAIMGVAPETVSRWESDAQAIGGTADRLLRLLVANDEPREEYAAGDLRLVESGTTPPRPIAALCGPRRWRLAA